MNQFFAEFFGTAMILVFGCGVVANVLLKKTKGNNAGWIVITFGWAVGVFTGVLISASVSGAHLNPAVTLALAIAHKFSWVKVPMYILAQVLGAMFGAGLTWLAYKKHFDETADAMAEFEVVGWVKEQRNDAKYFDKEWRNKGLSLVDMLEYFRTHEKANGYEIYGAGGGNRWFVRADGIVELSGGHTPVHHRGGRSEYVKKAKRHGFEVINYEYYANEQE